MGMLYEYDLADQVAIFGTEALVEGLVNEIESWGGQQ
jgi:hypothetical protein